MAGVKCLRPALGKEYEERLKSTVAGTGDKGRMKQGAISAPRPSNAGSAAGAPRHHGRSTTSPRSMIPIQELGLSTKIMAGVAEGLSDVDFSEPPSLTRWSGRSILR